MSDDDAAGFGWSDAAGGAATPAERIAAAWAPWALWSTAPLGICALLVASRMTWGHDLLLVIVLGIVLIQVAALSTRRADRGYLRGGLWLAPIPNLLAASLLHPLAGALAAAAGLACVLVGLGIAQAAAARARAAELARRSRRTADDDILDDAARDDVWRRDRAALGLVLPALALALLFLPIATLDPVRWLPSPGSHGPSAKDDAGSDGSDGEGDDGGTPQVGANLPAELDPWLARQVLVEVAPSRDGAPTGPVGDLYLRMLTYVDVDGAGTWTDDTPNARRRRDADDGKADGWCDVDVRPSSAESVHLAVRVTALQHATTGRYAVLAPPGVASVALPQIRYVQDALIQTDVAAQGGKLQYRLLCRDPSKLPFPTDRTRVVLRDVRATSLPPGLPGADLLVAEAAAATAGRTSDLGRVRSVVRRVHDTFAYADVGDPAPGETPLESFLRNRAGTCEQFAQATVVMLRSQGIPARMVTGFLLNRWDPGAGAYLGRGRDAHAWVEVDFGGCDWVVFDPTPDAPDDDGSSRPPPVGEPTIPMDVPGEDAPTPSEPEDPHKGLDDLLDSLSTPFGEHAWIWIAAIAIAFAFAGSALLRRVEGPASRARAALAARTPWDRLLADLARRGHVRAPWQTQMEFAAAVVAAGGDAWAPFLDLAQRQQAARFGGQGMSDADDAAVDAFRSAL